MRVSSSWHDNGFTLIEALVALLVLAVGILGLASMQLKALQGAHASYQRSVATMAAQDLVERLWVQLGMQGSGSDLVACPAANDTLLVKNSAYDPADPAESNPTEELTGTTVYDSWYVEWVKLLPTLIDNVAEAVVKDSATCRYTIKVNWDDERFLGEDVSELVYRTSIISG